MLEAREASRAREQAVPRAPSTPKYRSATNWAVLVTLPLALLCFLRSGPILWGFLFLSVLGVHLAYRASMLAKECNEEIPHNAAMSGCLGLLGIPTCLVMLLLSSADAQKAQEEQALQARSKRINALQARVSNKTQASLSRELACDLFQIDLVAHKIYGFDDTSEIRCESATIKQVGLRAVLRGAYIKMGNDSTEVSACFVGMGREGTSWHRSDTHVDCKSVGEVMP
ncbi:hypothetical protein [Archangium violaceum]|uniref:hypothetical protein n=2 Tax=Archangium violaceum TaxID=83451 RepID=UPI0036DB7EA8